MDVCSSPILHTSVLIGKNLSRTTLILLSYKMLVQQNHSLTINLAPSFQFKSYCQSKLIFNAGLTNPIYGLSIHLFHHQCYKASSCKRFPGIGSTLEGLNSYIGCPTKGQNQIYFHFRLKTAINVYMSIFSQEGRTLLDSQISLYWSFSNKVLVWIALHFSRIFKNIRGCGYLNISG